MNQGCTAYFTSLGLESEVHGQSVTRGVETSPLETNAREISTILAAPGIFSSPEQSLVKASCKAGICGLSKAHASTANNRDGRLSTGACGAVFVVSQALGCIDAVFVKEDSTWAIPTPIPEPPAPHMTTSRGP